MQKLALWIKSKTIWFGFLLSIFGVVEASMNNFIDVMSPTFYGFSMMGVGIVICILRFLTTVPVDEK